MHCRTLQHVRQAGHVFQQAINWLVRLQACNSGQGAMPGGMELFSYVLTISWAYIDLMN